MDKHAHISEHLFDLLHHYDCVVIPELGGFVTEYRSARIDKALHIIHPPSKDLRFNAQLKKNDGLLANALSLENELSHEACNAMLKAQVEAYFTELEGGQAVRFDKVGVLYLDSKNNIQFKADSSTNFLLDSFRLNAVYAKAQASKAVITKPAEPLVEEQEEAQVIAPASVLEPEPMPEPSPVVEAVEAAAVISMEPKSKTNWYRVAAVLLPFILYLGLVLYKSDVIHDGDIVMSDLNPFKGETAVMSYEARRHAVELPQGDVLEFSNDYSEPEVESNEPPVESASPEPVLEGPERPLAEAVNTYVAPEEISLLEYHVIGGCFGNYANAEGLVETLRAKGYAAFIIDERKGLHRVAYGSYAQRQEALDVLKIVKQEEQAGAWLLRKR